MKLAPIILFVYNRPWHTQQTLEALQKNKLAQDSELFIYADNYKNEATRESVLEVRRYIKGIIGFKAITIIEQDKNLGLAASIIDGVTQTVNKYGKVIVLEDDIVTSPYFLQFMNEALEFYQNEDRVMHISGWNYPINIAIDGDVFLWRLMNCWGWATWDSSWRFFEKDIDKLINNFSKNEIKKFNLDNAHNFFSQVLSNKNKKIDTWAIFWYATIFKKGALCVNPLISFVENIGFDGSGIHCVGGDTLHILKLNVKNNIVFEKSIGENMHIVKETQTFYKNQKKNILIRMINKIYRFILKKNLIK